MKEYGKQVLEYHRPKVSPSFLSISKAALSTRSNLDISARVQSEEEYKRKRPINYLEEFRREKLAAGEEIKIGVPKFNWRLVAENKSLSAQEIFRELDQKTLKHEELAKSYEQVMIRRGCMDDEVLTNAYLESVQAKLAMLNTLV